MGTLVDCQMVSESEGFSAKTALKGLLARVDTGMCLKSLS